MEIQNFEAESAESEETFGPGPIPGDELYLIRGRVLHILCSVSRSSTQWMATSVVVSLDEWR